jgi:hypothetical protein
MMTDTSWQLRRCDACGTLEADVDAEFVVERRSGEVDRVVHVVGGGLRQCGVLVTVDGEVTP